MGQFVSALIVCAIFFASTTATRTFSEDYIEGLYGRFFEFTEEGNSSPCPQNVDHSGRGAPSAMGDSWIVPHNQIRENGIVCNDRGVLVLRSYNSTSKMPLALESSKIAKETFTFMKDDSTGFWLGTDARTCGKWKFPNPSYVFFVKEFEREIKSSFNLKLAPGKKYMFVVAPKFTCIYKEIPRRGTPPDVVIAAPVPVSAPNSSESEGEGDSSNDREPADEAAESGQQDDSGGNVSIADIDDGTQPPSTSTQSDDGANIADLDSAAESDQSDLESDIESEQSDIESEQSDIESDMESDSEGVNGGGDGEIIDINSGEIEEDLSGDDGSSVCFPGDATVELSDGSKRQMQDLAIGDEVRVGRDAFSRVFMFTHRWGEVAHVFVEIRVANGRSIRLTQGHMLYVNDRLTAAQAVKVGDTLRTEDGTQSKATQVKLVHGRGLYNPQTIQGDVVVNGIVASTYTTTIAPAISHGLLTPLRAVWSFLRVDAAGSFLDSRTFQKAEFGMLNSDGPSFIAYN